jgi:hypothetical protein
LNPIQRHCANCTSLKTVVCCSFADMYQHPGCSSFLQNVGTCWQNCTSQSSRPYFTGGSA